jgi:hypothetical protein
VKGLYIPRLFFLLQKADTTTDVHLKALAVLTNLAATAPHYVLRMLSIRVTSVTNYLLLLPGPVDPLLIQTTLEFLLQLVFTTTDALPAIMDASVAGKVCHALQQHAGFVDPRSPSAPIPAEHAAVCEAALNLLATTLHLRSQQVQVQRLMDVEAAPGTGPVASSAAEPADTLLTAFRGCIQAALSEELLAALRDHPNAAVSEPATRLYAACFEDGTEAGGV